MTLKEYLLEQLASKIALLWFEGGDLKCEEYESDDYDKIRIDLLEMTFMDYNEEEDCKEIWIR